MRGVTSGEALSPSPSDKVFPSFPASTRASVALFFLFPLVLAGNNSISSPAVEPEIHSVFPVAWQTASTVEVEIRGKALEEVYAAWFSTDGIRGLVRKIEVLVPEEEDSDAKKTPPLERLFLSVEIDWDARVGLHLLRLVSSGGLSSALSFYICAEPVTEESEAAHHTPGSAQELSFPVVVNGRISGPGEVDYYQFEIGRDQELSFEVIASRRAKTSTWNFTPYFVLFDAQGSWFDPERPRALASSSELTHDLTYRCRTGRYLLAIRSLLYNGMPDYTYPLRIRPTDASVASSNTDQSRAKPERTVLSGMLDGMPGLVAAPSAFHWRERDFTRKLTPDRLEVLQSRALQVSEGEAVTRSGSPSTPHKESDTVGEREGNPASAGDSILKRVVEREPNDDTTRARTITIPALIEGTIERSEDVDSFKFRVSAGQGVAFEIETPEVAPPRFFPRIEIIDAHGREVLTNIHKMMEIAGTGWRVKAIEAKVVYIFEQAGDYTLQLRDSAFFGSPGCRYRLLIRPQVPHLGEIEIMEDRINLFPEQVSKLTLVIDIEENHLPSFAGGVPNLLQRSNIAITAEGLPPGVEILPAAQEEEDLPPVRFESERKSSFVPNLARITVVLHALRSAPAMTMPKWIRLIVRPIVRDSLGPRLTAGEIPLMILKRPPFQLTEEGVKP